MATPSLNRTTFVAIIVIYGLIIIYYIAAVKLKPPGTSNKLSEETLKVATTRSSAILTGAQQSTSGKGYVQYPSSQRKKSIRAYYRGYLNAGNIGDDLLEAVITKVLIHVASKKNLQLKIDNKPQDCSADLQMKKHYDLYIVGGGSLLRDVFFCHLRRGGFSSVPLLIAGSGFDDYWYKIKSTARYDRFQQGEVSLFTDSESYVASHIVPILKTHRVFGGVRGPYSYSILKHTMNTSESLPEIGDTAHLTAQYFGTDPNFDVYSKFGIPKGEQYIVVNMAGRTGLSYELTAGSVDKAMKKALVQLARTYHIIIYPMATMDLKYIKKFIKDLQKEAKSLLGGDMKKIEGFTVLLPIPKIGSLVRGAFFTINYLLHANYLSGAYETPFVALIYRMKLLDLVGSMDFWDYAVKMQTITGEEILKKVDNLKRDRDNIVERLKAQNEKVTKQTEAAFGKALDAAAKKHQLS